MIDGGTVKGSTIKAGKNWDGGNETAWMLYANSTSLHLGNFHITEYSGRYIIESEDSWVGMSPEVDNKTGKVTLWANYHPTETEDYDFSVSQSGNVRVKDLYVYGVFDMSLKGTSNWKNHTLTSALDWIWEDNDYGLEYCGHEIRSLWRHVEDLEDAISNLG